MAKVRLYIPRIEFAKVDSGAIWASGAYGYELLDYNPNSYATAASNTVSPIIRLDADLGGDSVQYVTWNVNFAGLYMANMDELAGDSGNVQLQCSTSPAWGSPTNVASRSFTANYAYQPLMVVQFASMYQRYWRAVVTTSAPIPKVAMWLIGTYFDLSVRWDFGETDSTRFFVERQELTSGRILTRLQSSQGAKLAARTFDLLGTADLAALRNAHQAAYGSHVPFLYCDEDMSSGFNTGLAKLVRFTSDSLGEVQVAAGLWKVSVGIEEVMQLTQGRAY
jgi:hypothetical protein